MFINLEADYAIRIVCALAADRYVKDAKSISEEVKVTLRFSLKILRKLVQAGIVKSFKGSKGGYILNREPEDISLKDIIEVIDGPVLISKCLGEEGCCNRSFSGMCNVQDVFAKASELMSNELGSHSVAELILPRV